VSTPTTTARRAQEIPLEQIEVGGNVRELDAEHVTALAGSMAVRGLIVPIAVRPLDGDRFALVAGEHRLAAARELGWTLDRRGTPRPPTGPRSGASAATRRARHLPPAERQVRGLLAPAGLRDHGFAVWQRVAHGFQPPRPASHG
jgi:ParB/Sulfiredoxin domain